MTSISRILLPLLCILFLSHPGSLFAGVSAAPTGFTLDFEDGTLTGWKVVSGDAFDYQPTLGDNPTARNRGMPSGHQGDWWIGTYENYQGRSGQKAGDIQGDVPQGILESPSFPVEGGMLSFLVGGGSGEQTRVELDILSGTTWKPVLTKSGKNSETMEKVTWDLAPYEGKSARIRVVDASSEGWGHINLDDIRFEPIASRLVQEDTAYKVTPPLRSDIAPVAGLANRTVPPVFIPNQSISQIVHFIPHRLFAIQSEPPGADLQVDGMSFGTTPVEVMIEPGDHEITLKLDGYQDLSRTESISTNLTRVYTLVPVSRPPVYATQAPHYTITIDSDPPGADLQVDGIGQGSTPASVTVDPGMHEISLTLDGYKDFITKEPISRDSALRYSLVAQESGEEPVTERPSVTPTLAPHLTVTIESNPPGADLRVDGIGYGSTPASVEVDPGIHEISLTLLGYEDFTRRESVQRDRTLRYTLVGQELHYERPHASVIIDSNPRGATLIIGATEYGATPVNLPVEPEIVTLHLKKPGYDDLVMSVDLGAVGENEHLVYNLTQTTGQTPVITPTPIDGPGFSVFTALGAFFVLLILGIIGLGRKK